MFNLTSHDSRSVAPLTTSQFYSNTTTKFTTIDVDTVSDTLVLTGDNFSDNQNISTRVYTWNGSAWSHQQTITPPQTNTHAHDACSRVDGDTLAVGLPRYVQGASPTNNFGRLYIYKRSGLTWSQEAEIINATEQSYFGWSVDINDATNTAVVGSPYRHTDARGEVMVYTRSGSTWTIQQTITSNSPADNDMFGMSVSLSGDTLAVGVPYDDTGGTNKGSVEVWTRSGSVWTHQQTLTETFVGPYYGNSVYVNGDNLFVAGPYGVYAYSRTGSVWSLTNFIPMPIIAVGDFKEENEIRFDLVGGILYVTSPYGMGSYAFSTTWQETTNFKKFGAVGTNAAGFGTEAVYLDSTSSTSYLYTIGTGTAVDY